MIKIICIGKLKEKYLQQAEKEYIKRLTKYNKVKIIELNNESLDKKTTLEKEGNKILEQINNNEQVITLDINGKTLDSITFAKELEKKIMINSQITFIIGGSYGLSEKVKKRSDFALSFSKLTFPHQLFRIIFIEQLYRAYKIINNETYHK